jgi:antitoxin protein of toxin-antitoxin system
MSRIAEWLKKAEEFARGHSKQTDQVLDRAEQYVKERTGHKYDDQITKGVDSVQSRYGGGGQQQEQQQPPQPQEEQERRTPPQG